MKLIKTAAASVAIIAAIAIVGYLSAWTPAEALSGPDGCSARSNPYVGEPTVSTAGRVTHDLTDMYGNSYNYNDANGGWGRAKVLGYHVKSDGPHGWVWRAGTSTTISYGQVVTACIEQKVKPHWHNAPGAKPWNWIIVSPEVSRPQG